MGKKSVLRCATSAWNGLCSAKIGVDRCSDPETRGIYSPTPSGSPASALRSGRSRAFGSRPFRVRGTCSVLARCGRSQKRLVRSGRWIGKRPDKCQQRLRDDSSQSPDPSRTPGSHCHPQTRSNPAARPLRGAERGLSLHGAPARLAVMSAALEAVAPPSGTLKIGRFRPGYAKDLSLVQQRTCQGFRHFQ